VNLPPAAAAASVAVDDGDEDEDAINPDDAGSSHNITRSPTYRDNYNAK